MIDKKLISKVLSHLEESGWSELICSRWKNDVINNIREKFPNIDDMTLNYVLKIVLI